MKTNIARLEKPLSNVRVSCKLTNPELQLRKKTVIANLQKQVLERIELNDGYAYRFEGTDQLLDELTTFIKMERMCCDFFDFKLSINNDRSVWLELTGPAGTKDFIDVEIEL